MINSNLLCYPVNVTTTSEVYDRRCSPLSSENLDENKYSRFEKGLYRILHRQSKENNTYKGFLLSEPFLISAFTRATINSLCFL
jgi:hypothetical protein